MTSLIDKTLDRFFKPIDVNLIKGDFNVPVKLRKSPRGQYSVRANLDSLFMEDMELNASPEIQVDMQEMALNGTPIQESIESEPTVPAPTSESVDMEAPQVSDAAIEPENQQQDIEQQANDQDEENVGESA